MTTVRTADTRTFEDAELSDATFDLGISATAFHWLDEAAALAKIARLLKPGGWWAALWNVYGDDAYPDLFTKAAALLESLARNHALIDGNKRLAWVAMRLFLALNEADVRVPSPEVGDEFVRDLAQGKLELARISTAPQDASGSAGSGRSPTVSAASGSASSNFDA